MRPNIARGHEAVGCPNARMSPIMDVVENCLMEGLRNKRPEVAGGNITMKRKTENLVCSMLEGRGMEELLCLRTNSLLLSQLERGNGRNISSRKGRK